MSQERITGKYAQITKGDEAVNAFVPYALPPNPPIDWSQTLLSKYERASSKIGELNGLARTLLNPEVLTHSYMRQEAVLSSQIEGTRSTLPDLLQYEMGGVSNASLDDVREVGNYIDALRHGLDLLDEIPVSVRLMKALHKKLMHSEHGDNSHMTPGEFRTSQNWIGGTRPSNAASVPPPPNQVIPCMSDLEKFLNDETFSPLQRAALGHVQFETIHPFLDGNGRTGRLLILLLLYAEGSLHLPLIYPSLYFNTHRHTYYQLLSQVRLAGDWEGWLEFFADAVIATAQQAINSADLLLQQHRQDEEKIRQSQGSSAGSMLQVHRVLAQYIVANPKTCTSESDLAAATVNKALERLETLGIVREITGKKRNRLYVYSACLDIMKEAAQLPV